MKIKFCGAVTTVTGSCHLLTVGDHKILLDCGQFQGGKQMEAQNKEEFPFNAEEIECVILSHAHIDHCGRLPLLVKRGFAGNIYCTDATAQLLEIMLRDSAHIHEKDIQWKNKRNQRAGRPLEEPLYTIKDAEKTLKYVKPILYDQLIEINENIKICFNDAGHILGSAITEIWATEEDKTTKIVFSGDLGVDGRPILRDPTIIKKADVAIMETTYGNRVHPENKNSIEALIDIVMETVNRGGSVIIPSFAVGRTQEIIYQFNKFYDERPDFREKLDQLSVYIDSPMANNATKVFVDNAQVYDEEARDYLMKGDHPLEFPGLKFTKSTAESQALNFDKSSKIVISASGMCEAGRIRHHLKHHLWNPLSSIVFVGYQANGTLGRMIIDGAREVMLFGEPVQVNAEVHYLQGFSGHADQNGLLKWVKGFEEKPKQLFLVHGEDDAKADFAAKVKEETGIEATILTNVAEYDLVTGEVLSIDEAVLSEYDEEEIQQIQDRLASVGSDLEQMLVKAKAELEEKEKTGKVTDINNRLVEIEKAIAGLGTIFAK